MASPQDLFHHRAQLVDLRFLAHLMQYPSFGVAAGGVEGVVVEEFGDEDGETEVICGGLR
jgi:hypothetical protein